MQAFLLKRRLDGWDPTTDSLLDEALLPPEWAALFEDVLKCPELEPFDTNDRAGWEHRQETRFREALPRYPMLARIWDTYIDAYFNKDEVSSLRVECLQLLEDTTLNDLALSALEKLAAACEEASTRGVGLYLACE